MTTRRVRVEDVLSPQAWPHAKFIAKRMAVGLDHDGVVCIAEFGPDIYGNPVIKSFVTLEPQELAALRTFLMENDVR